MYLIFALFWGVILLTFIFMRIFIMNPFLDRFCDGILLKVFAIVSMIGLLIPILLRKKMRHAWMLPFFLIIATIMTTAVNYGILYGTLDYLSVYTREKWDKHPSVRYCMLDSLHEQYEFIGMTEQELKETLGEPTYITEYTGETEHQGRTAYQYMIGDDFIDGYTYDYIFDNGIVIDTSISQH